MAAGKRSRSGYAAVSPPDPGALASGTQPDAPFSHIPVLVEEVLALAPESPRLMVDCTLGAGGHAEALLRRFPQAELFGCDRDPAAVEAAQQRLAPFGKWVLVRQAAFSELGHHLLVASADFLLADLGVSSPQLEAGARGFSFSAEGPLDMRMDPGPGGRTAADLVNRERPEELRRILQTFGEERFAPRIVKAIEAARAARPIETTTELARIVAAAVPARFHRKGHHPATKTFQALRIAVNDELGELERLLDMALELLRPGGRIAVIAFHSLEDRLVKERFRSWESPCTCPPSLPVCICGKVSLGRRLQRKPIIASPGEQDRNPRSRSAKLRAFGKAGRES
jgi:16S rRNA (cytosine1402-N4)-methyltransferase